MYHSRTCGTATDRTLAAFCQQCRTIFEYEFDDLENDFGEHGRGGVHHVAAIDCKQAAENGCPICKTVWLRATQYGRLEDVLDLSLKEFSTWRVKSNGSGSYSITSWPADRIVVAISIGDVGKARGLGIVQIFADFTVSFAVEPLKPQSSLLSHSISSSSTGSDETWTTLSSWIDRCNSYCQCLGRLRGLYKPARLLDVGASENDNVYLRHAHELSEDVSYIALSHCWGSSLSCRLYDPRLQWDAGNGGVTIDKATSGLKMSSLPLTFREAVGMTRKLGIPYLWIDSLCIIQNCQEDWQAQSTEMGKLYRCAYLTLVAAGSQNSEDGLYHDREPAAVNPLIIAPKWNNRVAGQSFLLVAADFCRETVLDSFTGQRAWCLQERYLSQAVIHFGATQLAWECQQLNVCETFKDALPESLKGSARQFSYSYSDDAMLFRQLAGIDSATSPGMGSTKHTLANGEDTTRIANSEQQRQLLEQIQDNRATKKQEHKSEGDSAVENEKELDLKIYYLWSHIIEKYARTLVTFDTDRLIAIFGMATHLENILKESYIAGMWWSILPSQLLWTIDSGHRDVMINADDEARTPATPPGRRPSKRCAPTWSWASVKGEVLMPTPLRSGALIDVKVHDVLGRGRDALGFHSRLLLVVSGSIHRGTLIWNGRWNRWMMCMHQHGFGSQAHQNNNQSNSDLSSSKENNTSPTGSAATTTEAAAATHPAPRDATIFGIAEPDTDRDVPKISSIFGMAPIFCLPVINTGRHRKKALHNDPGVQLNGISGLLLGPVPDFNGFYQRIGVFHLLGHDDVELTSSFGGEDQDGLFCTKEENEEKEERRIILT